MTSTLLPIVATSPFSKHFDRDLYDLSSAPSVYHVSTNGSSTSLLIHYRPQAASPAPVVSTRSRPKLREDENSAPPIVRSHTGTPSHCNTPTVTTKRVRKGQEEPVFRFVASPRSKQRSKLPRYEARDACVREGLLLSGSDSSRLQNSTPEPDLSSNRSNPLTSRETPQKQLTDQEKSVKSGNSIPEQFPAPKLGRLSTTQLKEYETQSDELQSPLNKMQKRTDLSPFKYTNRRHDQHRLSEASSVFVHSLKTASISNGSFSIMHRSVAISRSSDSQTHLGGQFRCSTDSERPMTTTSIDEAALSRGIERRQVFQNLLNTEDSYVADLKALVYLHSTLLASATSISNTTRIAIQRNVVGLLHLHESLNARLHRVVFKAAAKKWADTVTPSRLRVSRNARLRSHEGYRARHSRIGRHPRNSIESMDVLREQANMEITDTSDILDIATIFHDTLTSFFAYEEYCANHQIIAHELQKRTPVLCSTYEAGMESLGRSLAAINQKGDQGKKGLTVSDLLIKPIQRICRYLLLLEDLLRCTPVVDSPSAHTVLAGVIQRIREVVEAVNAATDNHHVRSQIQHRWSVQDRLNLSDIGLSPDQFRELGQIHLCGVLYATYQINTRVDGCYAFCILFDTHFIVAIPGKSPGRFEVLCLIHLADLKIQSPNNGNGMQCHSALHTWKIRFVSQGHYRELLLSACSNIEEEQWLEGLRGAYEPLEQRSLLPSGILTQTYLDLKSVGVLFGPNTSPSRESSMQRAATVCNKSGSCQIILRNTHNPQDLQEYRNASPNMLNRSQSHATTNKIVVLAPKRTERSRLETILSDVWTKDKIPFPGMIASKSSQILRASAGSLVRKLSLASIHGSFSRRSESLTASSRKSHETLFDRRNAAPTFRVRKENIKDPASLRQNRPKGWSELDSMDTVVGRMIGGGTMRSKRLSFSSGDKSRRRCVKNSTAKGDVTHQVGLGDPASIFYADEDSKEGMERDFFDSKSSKKATKIEQGLGGTGKRKRWSNPIAMLKEIGSDGLRNILHSSK